MIFSVLLAAFFKLRLLRSSHKFTATQFLFFICFEHTNFLQIIHKKRVFRYESLSNLENVLQRNLGRASEWIFRIYGEKFWKFLCVVPTMGALSWVQYAYLPAQKNLGYITADFVYFPSYSLKCFVSCLGIWCHDNWISKIGLSQKRKALSKWNKKYFSLLL